MPLHASHLSSYTTFASAHAHTLAPVLCRLDDDMLCFPPAVTGSLLTGNYTSRLLSWPPYSSKGRSLSGWAKHTHRPLIGIYHGPDNSLQPLPMCPRTNSDFENFPHQTGLCLSRGAFAQDLALSRIHRLLLIPECVGCTSGWHHWLLSSIAISEPRTNA